MDNISPYSRSISGASSYEDLNDEGRPVSNRQNRNRQTRAIRSVSSLMIESSGSLTSPNRLHRRARSISQEEIYSSGNENGQHLVTIATPLSWYIAGVNEETLRSTSTVEAELWSPLHPCAVSIVEGLNEEGDRSEFLPVATPVERANSSITVQSRPTTRNDRNAYVIGEEFEIEEEEDASFEQQPMLDPDRERRGLRNLNTIDDLTNAITDRNGRVNPRLYGHAQRVHAARIRLREALNQQDRRERRIGHL